MKLKINNWKHYALSFLYISTTIIFQFSILQIGDSYLYQYQNYVTKGNRQDFKVEDVSIDESNKLKSNFTEQFADYEPKYLQTTCLVGSLKDSDTQINLCSGNQAGMNEIKDIKVEKGSFPKAANEIMIERSWNNHLPKQYNLQDTLRIDYIVENQRKTKVLTVSGIYESKVSEATPVFWGNNDVFHDVGKIELKNDFYFLSLATKEIPSSTTYYD